MCLQQNRTTRKTRISRTQGNQAFVGWGGLDRTKINLHNLRLLCFRFRKWLVGATYLLYRLDAEILASGWFFFSEKGRHPKFVNRKWQIEENQKEQSACSFKHYRRLPEA